uniref:Uncharacterized protein n=1 Tax=Anguilla anguilla TaxID=7936 RepID=A0A0E9SX33_ANGAN
MEPGNLTSCRVRQWALIQGFPSDRK